MSSTHAAVAAEAHEHHDAFGSKLGMWLFLLTELLLFGTLFIIFASYFFEYTHDYHAAARELSRLIGGANTVVLLTSSLTIVLALRALQVGRRRACLRWMLATIGLALTFLVVKGFEWHHKFEVGIYFNSQSLLARPHGEVVFFGLYFVMTGLHALHVIIGGSLIGAVAWKVKAGTVTQERIGWLDNAALYWHFVDVIWIFLFPLFYLIGR